MSDTLDLTPEAPAPIRRSRRRLYGVGGLLALALGVLLYQGMSNSLDYYKTVDDVLNHRASVGTMELRLEGLVVKGSVVRTSRGADFEISGSKGRVVEVHAIGEPPQLFRPNIPVVVVGSFTSDVSTTFRATQIMVKHTSTYKAAHPNRVKAPDGSVQ